MYRGVLLVLLILSTLPYTSMAAVTGHAETLCAYRVRILLLDDQFKVVMYQPKVVSFVVARDELGTIAGYSTGYSFSIELRAYNGTNITYHGISLYREVGDRKQFIDIKLIYLAPRELVKIPAFLEASTVNINVSAADEGVWFNISFHGLEPPASLEYLVPEHPLPRSIKASILVNESGVFYPNDRGLTRIGDMFPLLPLQALLDPYYACCSFGSLVTADGSIEPVLEKCCGGAKREYQYQYLGLNCSLIVDAPRLYSTCRSGKPIVSIPPAFASFQVDMEMLREAVKALAMDEHAKAERILRDLVVTIRENTSWKPYQIQVFETVLHRLLPDPNRAMHTIIVPISGVEGAHYALVYIEGRREEEISKMISRLLSPLLEKGVKITGYETDDCVFFRVYTSDGGVSSIGLVPGIASALSYSVDNGFLSLLWERASAGMGEAGVVAVDLMELLGNRSSISVGQLLGASNGTVAGAVEEVELANKTGHQEYPPAVTLLDPLLLTLPVAIVLAMSVWLYIRWRTGAGKRGQSPS